VGQLARGKNLRERQEEGSGRAGERHTGKTYKPNTFFLQLKTKYLFD